jgi:hypothetical protein
LPQLLFFPLLTVFPLLIYFPFPSKLLYFSLISLFFLFFFITLSVSSRFWVCNTHASYYEDPGFKYLPGDFLSFLLYFMLFLSPSR